MTKPRKKTQSESPKKIAVCYCGTPLIWTFVFRGAEYWCPGCQSNFGMMDIKKVESTPELEFQHIINQAATKKYLHARGVFACSAMEIKGVYTERKDFPQSMLDNALKVITEYKAR